MLRSLGHAMPTPASRGGSQFCWTQHPSQVGPTLQCLLLRCLQVIAARRCCWALADMQLWVTGAVAAPPT